MFNRNATSPQLGAWIVAAMVAPIAQFAAGQPWPTVGLAAAGGLLLCLTAWNWGANPELPGWLWAVQWAWLVLVLPGILSRTGECWPEAKKVPTIPLILLLLATLSAERGAAKAARACATAFWLIGLLMAGILGAGIKELQPQWLLPAPSVPSLDCFWIFLLPALLVFLPGKRPAGGWLLSIGILAVGIAAWTGGAVSPQLAAGEASPFYLYSKSLTIFGAAKRMEALTSAALTMSWFCVLSWVLAASGHHAERIHRDWGQYFVWVGAILAAILLSIKWQLPDWAAAAGAVVLWIAVPILFAKKSEKRGKRA